MEHSVILVEREDDSRTLNQFVVRTLRREGEFTAVGTGDSLVGDGCGGIVVELHQHVVAAVVVHDPAVRRRLQDFVVRLQGSIDALGSGLIENIINFILA